MSAGARVPLLWGFGVATKLVALLAVACERIEIAGSIRRRRPMIGDVEIVCIPRAADVQFDLVGEPVTTSSPLDRALGHLFNEGVLEPHEKRAMGGKYKRLWYPFDENEPAARYGDGIQVDLFIVTPPAEWGPALLIRTGPADFSRRMVTRLRDYRRRCEDLRIQTFEGAHVPCPTEEEFFALCQMPFIPPERRS